MDRVSPPHRCRLLSSDTLARFISFEGGEGAGKSTQVRALATRLETSGGEVVCTREPGGSEGAEAVRTLLVQGDAERWQPASELFLFMAARHDHLERTIRPALQRGAWVITDRFWDSTRVYQGLVGGLPLAAIDALHEAWLGTFRPALTLLLDLPVDTGLRRASPGRFEAKGRAFHERVREAFLDVAAAEPERFVVIDADGDVPLVAERVARAVADRLPAEGRSCP